ncbi:hypothetical protein OM076_24550 [Solirubrobacter ginsenosidimutans]|uniref:Uncharacterized protein n=1 Tax=Solirubrobacter ginsenosidimutans TaxID=490573 RepID=A0A9X3MW19_9ACTN|nr:hypothetical protein [Solirubrobacter ginsenosidimutans]MDA0163467.1 hypothetical protein [Solirubrobacter ginsenosidimutans]
MGDVGGPAADTSTPAAEPAIASPQDAADAAPAACSDSGPAVTAMGDVGGPAADTSTPSADTDTTTADPPAVTAMGDYAGPASAPAETSDTTTEPATTTVADDGPTYTPMGDVASPGAESTVPAAQPEATTPASEPDGFTTSLTATLGLGATVGFAHDSQYTSITLGTAEGTGFFGSAGQGKAAQQTTPGASVKGGLGFVSGELRVDQTGITGKANLNMPINPGINQTVDSYSAKLNPDFTVTTARTEGMSYGMQVGLATTQTVTIAIPNSAFETVANWLGLGPQSANRSGGW